MIGDRRVGRVLAGLRDRKMTQAALARKVGIHPSTLSKYENQGRIPEDLFLRICEELGYEADLVVESALQAFRQDLQKARSARSASASAPSDTKRPAAERRPSLARLGELFEAYSAAKWQLMLAVLQFLAAEVRSPSGELQDPDLTAPRNRKRRKPR